MITHARNLLTKVLEEAKVDSGHGIDHAEIVLGHARKALVHEDLTDRQQQAVQLAALLHDADDSKFFPDSTDYQNARSILQQVGADEELTELIIKMIDLVSCSKNRNTVVKPSWLLLPRYCDRLEAMGVIGVLRCYQYTLHTKRPVFTLDTPRACTLTELYAIASPERFQEYRGKSASMMDHFYDKLMHLVGMDTTNKYIVQEAQDRHQVIVNFCLQFGRTGTIDTDWLERSQDLLSTKN